MGDIMMGTENLLPEDGGAGSFAAVKEFLADADVIFGNLEGPLTDRGACTKKTGTGKAYCFRTPPGYVKWLKDAGFTMVSLANNHNADYGPEGKKQTIELLDGNGIAWSARREPWPGSRCAA